MTRPTIMSSWLILSLATCCVLMAVMPPSVKALEGSVQKVSFQSAVYDRESFFLAYTPPDSICEDVDGMPLIVYLPGFGNVPDEDPETATGEAFEAVDKAISDKDACCSLFIIPDFDLGPFGGYWYINNRHSRPEDFLLLEVLPQAKKYYGDRVAEDPSTRTLVGHSMGGFGALRHGLVYGGEYFNWIGGFNPAATIWTSEEYKNVIKAVVLQEQMMDPLFPGFDNCPSQDGEGPIKYYADGFSFLTLVTSSLAYIMNSDYEGVRDNSPYIGGGFTRINCTEYVQLPNYQFFLDENGEFIQATFDQLQPDYSPLAYVLKFGSILPPFVSDRIWMSSANQDMVVAQSEVVTFGSVLDGFGIDHTIYTYDGGHQDIYEGVLEMMKTFVDGGSCSAAADLRSAGDDDSASSPRLNHALSQLF